MGLKSLFNRKKKRIPLPNSLSQTPAISRNPSLNSKAQIEEELSQVFNKFDANGDGKISSSELGSIMSSLGHSATDEELVNMIKEVDSDGDGFIDLNEFIELNTKGVDSEELLENLKHAFDVFDVDKNGVISAEELMNVLVSLGEECDIEECRKMIGGVDSDGDGTISFEEFKVMMTTGSRFDSLNWYAFWWYILIRGSRLNICPEGISLIVLICVDLSNFLNIGIGIEMGMVVQESLLMHELMCLVFLSNCFLITFVYGAQWNMFIFPEFSIV